MTASPMNFSTVAAGTGMAAHSCRRHSPQNFWPGAFGVPHEVQTAVKAPPHSPQNFWPAGFSAPQLVQLLTAQER